MPPACSLTQGASEARHAFSPPHHLGYLANFSFFKTVIGPRLNKTLDKIHIEKKKAVVSRRISFRTQTQREV